MQKILSISADDFMKQGVSTGKHTTEGGLFFQAYGIDPFIVPGLLQSGISASQFYTTMSDTINYFIPSVSAGVGADYVFGMGTNGTTASIYRIDSGYGVSAMAALSASQALGFESFNGDFYYSMNTTVGKLSNFNSVVADCSWNSQLINLTATAAGTEHPLHALYTDLYIGDGYRLHSWNGSTKTSEELVLPSDYTIIDIDDDGSYLIIAAVKKGRAGITKAINKIYYWDTISDNNFYSVEWEIPEGIMTGISKSGNGNEMIAFTGQGMYTFSVSNSPKLIIPGNDSQYYPVSSNDLSPFSGAIQNQGGCLVWASGGHVLKYGKIFNNLRNILTYPITLANIKSIYVDAYNRMIASTTDKNVYRITSTNGTGTLKTGSISLPQPTLIQKIKVYTNYVLTAGQSIRVQIYNESTNTDIIDKTFDSSTVDVSKLSWVLPCSALCNQVNIFITLTGGVTFKKLELYGEPRPYESTV